MPPTTLRNARRPMSTESLARSATETRIVKRLSPVACQSVRADAHDSEALVKGQYASQDFRPCFG